MRSPFIYVSKSVVKCQNHVSKSVAKCQKHVSKSVVNSCFYV
jgi:hypothetical protein